MDKNTPLLVMPSEAKHLAAARRGSRRSPGFFAALRMTLLPHALDPPPTG